MPGILLVDGRAVALGYVSTYRGPWAGETVPYRLRLAPADLRLHADPLLAELADDLRACGDVDHASEQAWLDAGLPAPADLWRATPGLYADLLRESDLSLVVVDRLLVAAHAEPPATAWLTVPATITAAPDGLWLAGLAISSEAVGQIRSQGWRRRAACRRPR